MQTEQEQWWLERGICRLIIVWVNISELQKLYALDLSNILVQVTKYIMFYNYHLQTLLEKNDIAYHGVHRKVTAQIKSITYFCILLLNDDVLSPVDVCCWQDGSLCTLLFRLTLTNELYICNVDPA